MKYVDFNYISNGSPSSCYNTDRKLLDVIHNRQGGVSMNRQNTQVGHPQMAKFIRLCTDLSTISDFFPLSTTLVREGYLRIGKISDFNCSRQVGQIHMVGKFKILQWTQSLCNLS